MLRWAQRNPVLAAALIAGTVSLLVAYLNRPAPSPTPTAEHSPAPSTPKSGPPASSDKAAVPQARAPRVFSPPLFLLDWTPRRYGEAAREDLRRDFRLRALLPAENDHLFSKAPTAVYGYTDVGQVKHFVNVGTKDESQEFRLRNRKNVKALEMEVHKLENASTRLVGFIRSSIAPRVATPSENFTLTLYNIARTEADYLISLPIHAVKRVHDLRLIPTSGDKREPCVALDLEVDLESYLTNQPRSPSR